LVIWPKWGKDRQAHDRHGKTCARDPNPERQGLASLLLPGRLYPVQAMTQAEREAFFRQVFARVTR